LYVHVFEPLLLVDQLEDVVLRVFELGAPEQRVEGAHLDADPAVHAQRVVDGETVEHLDRPAPAATHGLVRLLVGVDVDAPVGALPRALVADRAVGLLQGDDPARPGREVRLDVRVLLGDRTRQQVLERHAQALEEPDAEDGLLLRAPARPSPDFLFAIDRHLVPFAVSLLERATSRPPSRPR